MSTAAAGRKKTPAHLKLVSGRTPTTDSGGRPITPPPPFTRRAPTKPEGLSPAASRMWDAIVGALPDANLLKPIDGFALEVGCETWARWHTAKSARLAEAARSTDADSLTQITSQGVGVNPLVRIESEASRDFRAWCAEFGLTPAAEAKLSTGGDKSVDGDLF